MENQPPEKKENQESRFNSSHINALIVFVVVSWLLTWFITINKLPSWSTRGQFGDMFGSINSLFSGVALIFVIFTIGVQRSEMKDQIKLINIQRFETKFFNLLSLFNEIANTYGRTVYGEILRDISKKYSESSGKDINSFIEIYQSFCEDNRLILSQYFRTLYHIVKFVDESNELNDTEKYDYIKILRSQLSTAEIALLCYNGLTSNGSSFNELYYEKYKLLDNLDKRDIVNHKMILIKYPYI